jgi:DNA-binding NtrC family response regulator
MGARPRLLVIEDDAFLRRQIAEHFAGTYAVSRAGGLEEGAALLKGGGVDLVLLDIRIPPHTDSIEAGLAIASRIHELSPGTLTVTMGGDRDRETMLRAAEAGVYGFLLKPLDIRELDIIVRRALDRSRLDREVRRLRDELRERFDFKNFKGNSPGMRAVKGTIRKVADSNTNILIRGESGTGKELVARALHFNSARRDGPFVTLNCSAFPEHLIEDELFGHEKGAFTGAVGLREGRFEMADGGTLFLDELGRLTPAIQAKLLSILETRSFERLGGVTTIRVDIRLVCATDQDLEADVRQDRFRQDLYSRINVVAIRLPPLRERIADIPMLSEHFLERFCRENNKRRKRLSPEVVDRMLSLEWRGNVRELEHFIESLVLLTEGDMITLNDLPGLPPGMTPSSGAGVPEGGIVLEKRVADFERGLLADALKKAQGVKKEAAALLGLSKDQMKYLCRKYSL